MPVSSSWEASASGTGKSARATASPIDPVDGFFYCVASPGREGNGRCSRVGLISSMNSTKNGSATTVAASAPPQLLRALGWWEATAIVIGIMIGTGIFIVPAEITRSMGTRTRRSPCGRSRVC